MNKTKLYIITAGIVCCITLVSLIYLLGIEGSNIPHGLEIGSQAPDFTLVDLQKGQITRNMLLTKPLFIFFTTTWCTPCQEGARQLARYYDETNGSFNVLIVFVDPSESDTKLIEWKQKYGRDSWYVAKDYDHNMVKSYNVRYLDTKYVLDNNGMVRWFDTKPLDYITAKSILKPLIKQSLINCPC